MALIFPFEDQNSTPGQVRFTPCDLKGDPNGSGEIIVLYLPPSISFSDGANYEGFEMGVVGAVAMDGMNVNTDMNGTDAIASASSGVSSGLASLNSGGNVGRSILAKMAEAGPTQVVQGGLRIATNPNTRVLFKSVALRTFQFTFKMIPTSFQEAEEIKKIVLSFRSQMYPELAGGENDTSIGYVYPDMYLIEMSLGNIKVPPKVKASFLTSVTTTFNPSSGALIQEGGGNTSWSETDLTLTFGEGVTLDKKDILGGF